MRPRGSSKAPGPVLQDAHPKAEVLGGGGAREAPVLHGELLAREALDARVRVVGAGAKSLFDGELGDVLHGISSRPSA